MMITVSATTETSHVQTTTEMNLIIHTTGTNTNNAQTTTTTTTTSTTTETRSTQPSVMVAAAQNMVAQAPTTEAPSVQHGDWISTVVGNQITYPPSVGTDLKQLGLSR